jgi:hypothetical protein
MSYKEPYAIQLTHERSRLSKMHRCRIRYINNTYSSDSHEVSLLEWSKLLKLVYYIVV